MKASELLQAVRDDIDEASAAFWSDALLLRYINRAYKWSRNKIISFDEGFFEREVTVTYPASTRQTKLRDIDAGEFDNDPHRIILVEDISGGADSPVVLDRIAKVDEANYRLKGETFTNSQPVQHPGYYVTSMSGPRADDGSIPDTSMAIGMRPMLSGSRTLRITYIPGVSDLAYSADPAKDHTPDIPPAFNEVIVLRAVVLAKKREEAPVQDYEIELQRCLQDAINAIDGKGRQRVRITDPSAYHYS